MNKPNNSAVNSNNRFKSELLRKLRRDKDLTLKNVAELLGIQTQSYQQYESGRTIPPADKLAKLAELFGVTTDYLLGREAAPSVHGFAAEQAARDVRKVVEAIISEAGADWPKLGRLKEHLEKFQSAP